MTDRRQPLVRNVTYNLIGLGAPILVGIIAIPLLIAGLGVERFGVLTLAWAAIGYFSLFDLGMGRALTQALSAAEATGRGEEAASITRTALTLLALFGALGGVVLAVATPWLVTTVLRIPTSMQGETAAAFRLLAASLPFVVMTVGLRGVLEAYQAFGVVTALRIPYAVITFAGPLLVLPFSRSLVPVVAVLVAARLLLWVAHGIVVMRMYPRLRGPRSMVRGYVRTLLGTGGWMTVSNIVSPLMVNIDRYFIAATIGAAAVTWYVTPYEIATKLLLVPAAMLGVLFPSFAADFATDPRVAGERAGQATRLLLAGLFPACLALVTFAPEGLTLWVGPELAARATPVLWWLAGGVLINAVGHVPFTLLQGIGRPDITARLHLVELPLYVVTLVALARAAGVTGVAVAWTLRVAVDTAVLHYFARRCVPHPGAHSWQGAAALFALLPALAGVAAIAAPLPRFLLAGCVFTLFAAFAWHRLLRPAERRLFWPFGRAEAA